ncbi:MAG: hypothetical protein HY319_12450 [Armatimonadetes bacterium]|nr:hypothetical protein [Armatimonadota bacterium]
MRSFIFLCCWLLAGALQAQAGGTWLYATSFQRGELLVFDLDTGKTVHRLPVEDGAGIIGFDTSPDGKLLYVVDGSSSSRLRIFEASDLKLLEEERFPNRALMLGGPPVTQLAAGRWLLIQTYDYPAAAAGVRVYDTHKRVFWPLGLRDRPAGSTYATGGREIFGLTSEEAYRLFPPSEEEPDFRVGERVRWPFPRLSQAAASPDGGALYALEFMDYGSRQWRLGCWAREEGGWKETVRTVDLFKKLAPPDDPRGGSSSLALSPDGLWLAVQRGARAWLLDRKSLAVKAAVELSDVGDHLAFTRDSRALLTFSHDGRVQRVPVEGGPAVPVLKDPIERTGPPLQVLVAPAP